MPIFTGDPVVTVPADPFLWVDNTGGWPQGFSGPFHYSGAMYIVGFAQDVRPGVVIAKSTDSGATWNYFFQGALFPPEQWTGYQDVILNSAGQLVFLALESFVNGNLATFYFDLVGETFSSISYASGGIFNGTHPFCLAQRPSGDVLAIYTEASGAIRRLMYMPIVANAFGSPAVIDAGTGTEHLKSAAAVSDSAGVIHIAYTLDSPATLLYNTLDASNTPGTRQTIASGTFILANGLIFGVQPIFTGLDLAAPTAVAFIGDSLSGPAWTRHDLPSGSSATGVIAVDAGSTVKFLYSITDFSTFLQIAEADWNGATLGAMAVYWDIIDDPPVPGIPAAHMATAGITAGFNAGTLEVAVTTSVFYLSPNTDYTAVYVSSSGSAARYRNTLRWVL